MTAKNKKEISPGIAFGRSNYLLMAAGAALIFIGFMLMIGGNSEDPNVFNREELYSFRRITLAPVVVLAGFVVEVFAIFFKKSEPEGNK